MQKKTKTIILRPQSSSAFIKFIKTRSEETKQTATEKQKKKGTGSPIMARTAGAPGAIHVQF